MDEQPQEPTGQAEPQTPKRKRGRPKNPMIEKFMADFRVSRTQAYRQLSMVERLTERELVILGNHGVRPIYQVAIAELGWRHRGEVLDLIEKGSHPRNALAAVLYPNGGYFRLPNGQVVDAEAKPGEEELSDQDWLQALCGATRSKLADTTLFDREALEYRRNQSIHRALDAASNRAVTQTVNGTAAGPYSRLLWRLYVVRHPRHWRACEACRGRGRSLGEVDCEACVGAGFLID